MQRRRPDGSVTGSTANQDRVSISLLAVWLSRSKPEVHVVHGPGDENLGQSANEHRAFKLLQRLLEEDLTLTPEHREDLQKSGLTDETVARQRICSIFPQKVRRLLGH